MLLLERMAYVAGFFDGGGSITFSLDRSGTFVPSLQIVNKNFNVLDFCWTTFGLGGISEIRSDVYSWYITSRGSIEYVLNALIPFLIVKLPEAIWMAEYILRRGAHKSHNAPYTGKELQLVIAICESTRSKKDSKALVRAQKRLGEMRNETSNFGSIMT